MLRFLILILLLGCASTPTKIERALDAQAEAFFKKTAERNQLVTVIRDSGFTGSGNDVILTVDQKLVAQIPAGYKTKIYLTKGEHLFTVLAKVPIFSDMKVEERFEITEAETVLRIMFPGSGEVKLKLVD